MPSLEASVMIEPMDEACPSGAGGWGENSPGIMGVNKSTAELCLKTGLPERRERVPGKKPQRSLIWRVCGRPSQDAATERERREITR